MAFLISEKLPCSTDISDSLPFFETAIFLHNQEKLVRRIAEPAPRRTHPSYTSTCQHQNLILEIGVSMQYSEAISAGY